MERIKSIVANAKIMATFFFIHLHIVIIKDVRIVRNIIKIRKTSVLLNRSWNILIVIEKSYLRRWSKTFWKINVGLG